MREETVKKYLDKYSTGVVETENSLEKYNTFFKNMGFKETIEQLISKRLDDRVFVRVLDIGCGDGGFLADLKKQFDEQVHTIGIDLIAAPRNPDEMITGDALTVKFPKDIDFVFSFRTLHEIGEPEKMVGKIYESLTEGGKAFLSFRTLDLYAPGKGLAEIGSADVKNLQKIIRSRKLSSFKVDGFEAIVKDEKGKKHTAGVNIFLEK